jgi:hypothetical protein
MTFGILETPTLRDKGHGDIWNDLVQATASWRAGTIRSVSGVKNHAVAELLKARHPLT